MSELMKAEFKVDMLTITALHSQATKESALLADASIDNDEDAADANVSLKDWLSKLDKVSKMKKETLAPLKEAEKRINDLFKPLLDKGQALTGHVRGMLERYELEKRTAQREAMAKAAEAAQLQEPDALLTALTEAEDAAPVKLEGTSFRRVWVIKRIVEALLPDEYWTVDTKKIEAVGKAFAKSDTPFDIPGVVWEEQLSSTVRR
jgi:hypothetical protein